MTALRETFGDPDTGGWLDRLLFVASAPYPCEPHRSGPDPRRAVALGQDPGAVGELAGLDDATTALHQSVRRLLHAVWLLTDPLALPDDDVAERMAYELRQLSGRHSPAASRCGGGHPMAEGHTRLAFTVVAGPRGRSLTTMENPLRYRVFYTVRQKIVTSVVVLALLAVGTVVVVRQVTTPENRSCGTPGVARPPGSDECVGVATAGDGYHFGQAHLKNVVEAIGRQNAELAADEYVTVALLLPLTSTSGGFPEKVLRELQGAFAQQYAANLGQNGQTPRIRLVLANTGNGNAHWKTAVDQLKTMTGAPTTCAACRASRRAASRCGAPYGN